ncbi:unnamed protein product [Rotaria socialis]|uniref:Methyltransferase FkbM domain-containing protein n=1 Tax=Rotaria socialis TaxID=392032 RepID=A0A818JGI0_9BILA|nr:unnamed protein product [Rotaria socialis]
MVRPFTRLCHTFRGNIRRQYPINHHHHHYLPYTKFCTQTEADLQGEKYNQLRKESIFWSACYSDAYLAKFYLADLNMFAHRKMLFFDVGANKGYTIAKGLSLWMPHLGINGIILGEFLRQKLKLKDCGICNECIEAGFINFKRDERVHTAIEIHAFEPQPSTYQVLTKMKRWMNSSFLHIHKVALSNQSEIRALRKCPAEFEQCALPTTSNLNERNTYQKIETEGFDPLVIQGAENILNRHQVRLFLFEYHGIHMWRTTTLYHVINDLGHKGYLCYRIGQTGIFRLTGCWSSSFEIKRWSNVLCISRHEPRLISFVEELLIPV